MSDEFLKASSLTKSTAAENVISLRNIERNATIEQRSFLNNGEKDLTSHRQWCNEPNKKQLPIRPTSLSLNSSIQMSTNNAVDEVSASLDEGFSLLTCQEKICELYMHLHKPGSEEMLEIFGSIVLSFISDIKHVMAEKTHLESLYNKAKDQHHSQVKNLEEELELNTEKTEKRLKQEMTETFEKERKQLILTHKRQTANLQAELSSLRQAAASARSDANQVEQLLKELQEIKNENDKLKETLVDLNDNLNFVKGEIKNFQMKLDEKEMELTRQKKLALEDNLEIDNLVAQVNLLQSVNKTLHEKTDDLYEALRICRSYYKTQIKQKTIMTKDDFIQKYLDESCISYSRSVSREPHAMEIKSIKTSSSGFGDNEADDLESCQSALEDMGELDNINSISDNNSSLEKRSENNCSTAGSHGEPERVFKIVLAGDAAVGKSSFILRLCKDRFAASLNSTVGVDFQTKTLKVDGKVIALQLWDTAGQERFRSISKSYFRRADGVLLLYDVSYEHSFINVRDWIQVIQDGAQKHIPVMIVGNKSDLREDPQFKTSCMKFEDGLHLAKSVEGLFVETSAKNGSNIVQAIMELARALMAREDFEVRSVGLNGLRLKETEQKKTSFCC